MTVCVKTNVIWIKILWGAQKRRKRAHTDMRPTVADDPSLKLIQITLMPTNCTMLPKLLSSLFRRCPWNWERKILISNFIFTQISIMFISFSYLTFSRVFAHNIKPFKKCSLGLKTATILGVLFFIYFCCEVYHYYPNETRIMATVGRNITEQQAIRFKSTMIGRKYNQGNPEETSPEVRNRSISGPKMDLCPPNFFLKKEQQNQHRMSQKIW